MIPWRTQVEIVRSLLSSVAACRELHGVLRADHFANISLGTVAEIALRLGVEQGSPATEGQMQVEIERGNPLDRGHLMTALAEALAAQKCPAPWAVETGRQMAAAATLVRIAQSVESYTEQARFDDFAEAARGAAAIASGTGTSTFGLGDIEARHSPLRVMGIPTGIRRLNLCIRGHGWMPGQLAIILAPDGGGKTHAAVSFGSVALLQGLRVHHTTLEVDEPECRARYDRSLANIGSDSFAVHLPEVRAKLDELEARLTILEAIDRPMTVSGLEAEVHRLPPERKPDLIIVDSGYLLATGREGAADDASLMRHDLASAHQRLRIMGNRLRAPVLTPFQANREGMKMMQESRGSGREPGVITRAQMADALEVSRHADIVISLNQNFHEYASGLGRVWVDKCRGGKQFEEIQCRFAWDRSRIRDVTEAE